MVRSMLFLVLLLLAVTCAFAQPDPNAGGAAAPPPGGPRGGGAGPGGAMRGMMANMQQEPVMTITANGLFVLRAGVVAKFDLATMKPQGTLELFGPLGVQPVLPATPTDQDRQAQFAWLRDYFTRMAPATVLAKDDVLLIVQDNSFFRVNQKTMQMDAIQTELVKPVNGNAMRGAMMNMTKATVQLLDKTLYILTGTNLISLNAEDGTILNRSELPKELTPAMPNFAGMGGMGGLGRQGGAGGRQGGGRQGGGRQGGAAQPGAAQ